MRMQLVRRDARKWHCNKRHAKYAKHNNVTHISPRHLLIYTLAVIVCNSQSSSRKSRWGPSPSHAMSSCHASGVNICVTILSRSWWLSTTSPSWQEGHAVISEDCRLIITWSELIHWLDFQMLTLELLNSGTLKILTGSWKCSSLQTQQIQGQTKPYLRHSWRLAKLQHTRPSRTPGLRLGYTNRRRWRHQCSPRRSSSLVDTVAAATTMAMVGPGLMGFGPIFWFPLILILVVSAKLTPETGVELWCSKMLSMSRTHDVWDASHWLETAVKLHTWYQGDSPQIAFSAAEERWKEFKQPGLFCAKHQLQASFTSLSLRAPPKGMSMR